MNPEETFDATNGNGHAAAPHESPAHAAPVEIRMRARIHAFEDALARAQSGDDPDALHDLRVAARRLTEFLRVWRSLIPARCLRRIARDVCALRRRAGRARDLEVRVELLRERLECLEEPDEHALRHLAALEARLERRRHRAGKRMDSQRGRRVLARLAEAEQAMSRDLLSHLQAFEVAHARVEERRVTAIEAVRASLETEDDACLQRARIAIKKWRYAVECLGESRNGTAFKLDSLRDLQGVMGSLLDGAALRLALVKHLGPAGRGAAHTLPRIIEDLDLDRPGQLERFRALGSRLLHAAAQSPPDRAPALAGAR